MRSVGTPALKAHAQPPLRKLCDEYSWGPLPVLLIKILIFFPEGAYIVNVLSCPCQFF